VPGTRALVTAVKASVRATNSPSPRAGFVVARGTNPFPLCASSAFAHRHCAERTTWREVLRVLDDEIAASHPIKGSISL